MTQSDAIAGLETGHPAPARHRVKLVTLALAIAVLAGLAIWPRLSEYRG